MSISTMLLAMFLLWQGPATQTPNLKPDQWLAATEAQDAPDFGAAIALGGDLLAVSNGLGEVLVYRLDDDGLWQYEGRLSPTTPSAGFGMALAVSPSGRIAVLDETKGPRVYYHSSTYGWVLDSSDSLASAGKTFIDIDIKDLDTGDDLVVSYDDNGDRGIQILDYVWNMPFFRWELSATLTAPAFASELYGVSIDLESDRIAVGAPPDDAQDGTVVIYDMISNIWFQTWSLTTPTGLSSDFGYSVSLDGERLAVGAPASGGFGAPPSTVVIYERQSNGLWSWQTQIERDYGFGVHVVFQDDVLLVAEPFTVGGVVGMGRLVAFKEVAGVWTAMSYFSARSMSSNVEDYAYGSPGIAFDGTHVIGSSLGGWAPTVPSMTPQDGDVCSYTIDLANARFWQATDPTSIGSAAAWTTTGGGDAIFSLSNQPDHMVLLDGDTSFNQLVVRYSTVFDLNNESSVFGTPFSPEPSMRISGRNAYYGAHATLTGTGSIEFRDDLILGMGDSRGQLTIGPDVDLEIEGGFQLGATSVLQVSANGSGPAAMSAVIGGGLSVSLPEDASLEVDDVITLLTVVAPPPAGQDRFSIAVLPGLPNGLGFELQYGSFLSSTHWSANVVVVELVDLMDFDDPESTDVDSGAVDLVVTDLTGDGQDELCVLFGGTPGQLVIFNLNATGSIVEQIVISIGADAVGLTSGDLDGDASSTTDLAIANGNGTMQVLINDDNDPSDGFDVITIAVGALPGSEPTCIAAAQVDPASAALELVVGFDNGDGTGSFTTYSQTLLLGVGYGQSDNHNTTAPAASINPLEDEGKKDIPWGGTTKGEGDVVVAKRTSLGLNTVVTTYDTYPTGPDLRDIRLRDFDGDGDVDIAVTSFGSNLLIMLEQDAGGTFPSSAAVAAGVGPQAMTTADFDGDGLVDLAILTENDAGESVIRVYDNGGNMVFSSSDVAEGESPTLVGSGDVDGDGQVDLISIAANGSLLRGGVPTLDIRPVCTCPGDATCDGAVNVEDLLAVLSEFGCRSNCSADTNGDGIVDVEDLLSVIGNWNGCVERQS